MGCCFSRSNDVLLGVRHSGVKGVHQHRSRKTAAQRLQSKKHQENVWQATPQQLEEKEPLFVARPTSAEFAAMQSKEEVEPVLSVLGNGVDVRPSTVPGAGNGLFVTRAFVKDEPVTAYTGLLVSHAQAKKRNASHLRSLMPLQWVIDGLYDEQGKKITDVQAQRQGKGVAAMANDAQGRANVRFDFADSKKNSSTIFDKNPRERIVFLRALRDIEAGEEVFVDYGSGYWERAGVRRA